MMSIVALMVLLLPTVLLTTSAEKLTGVTLGVSGASETLPPEPPGLVEAITVKREAQGYAVSAAVRNSDVRASAGDTELRQYAAADLTELQGVLSTLKRLDPKRERITLVPAADTATDEVVRWMDAVRRGPDGELFPRVVLQAVATP